MPSAYLTQGELSQYGLPPTTSGAQIAQASALVDTYLDRKAGLQWMPDYSGLPCYMAALSSSLSIKLPSAISAGSNVTVTLPGPNPGGMGNGLASTTGIVGTTVILDRATSLQTGSGTDNVCEACVITNVVGNTITLLNVQQPHAQGALMEWGLVISEQRPLPSKRAITRLADWPIRRIHAGVGAYRYGRRNDQQAGLYDDRNLLSIMQTFGGPPAWQLFSTIACDFSDVSNEVWIPSGIQMAYYSDVRLWYVAGFPQSAIPEIIKQATAGIILANINTQGLQGGVKEARAGDTALSRFTNSVLDADMKAEINKYRARTWG